MWVQGGLRVIEREKIHGWELQLWSQSICAYTMGGSGREHVRASCRGRPVARKELGLGGAGELAILEFQGIAPASGIALVVRCLVMLT